MVTPDNPSLHPPDKIKISFILLFLLACIPIFMFRIPAIVDYPNHLARMHLLANWAASPTLHQFYEIRWAILPNLAMDMFVPFLARLMPIYWAGKVFIILLFLLLATGTIALHKSLYGKASYWPILALFLLYNRSFLWGFLNFLFGIGVMLWVLAGWIKYKNRSSFFRIGLFTLCSTFLFFCHLFSLGVYGLCIIGITASRIRNDKKGRGLSELTVAMGQFVLPAVLFLFFCPTADAASTHAIIFGGVMRKIGAVFQPLNNYNRVFDALTFLIIFGGITLGIYFKWIDLAPPIYYSLIILAVFFLIMPQHLLSAQAVDSRIPTPFAFLLIAGTNWRLQNALKKKGIAIVLLCLFLSRIAVVSYYWQSANNTYDDIGKAISQLREGSSLFTGMASPGEWQPFPVPLNHFPCIAVIEKSSFVPSLFAYPTQQPICYSEKYINIAKKSPEALFLNGTSPNWQNVSQQFDYVLLINEKNFKESVLLNNYDTIHTGESFRLLKRK